MDAATALRPVVDAALGTDLPVRIDCWDGSSIGPAEPAAAVRFTSPRALRRLVWAPNELGFARAYVSGDVEIDGDLLDALTRLDELADPQRGPGVHLGTDTTLAVVKAVARLRAHRATTSSARGGDPARAAAHAHGRDARAVSHHYDVGNDFYALVLGPTMVYSCAYFEQPRRVRVHAGGRAARQARPRGPQARSRPGMRLLDVGCGWGSFVIHAAREYGVDAVGVTLSEEQAAYARAAVAGAALAGRVEIRCRTTATCPTGRTTPSPASGWPNTSAWLAWPTTPPTCTACWLPRGGCSTTRSRVGPEPSGTPG